MYTSLSSIIRWMARCAAILVTGALLFLATAEIVHPHSGPPALFREWEGFALLACVIFGMLAAWKWELSGAIVSLVALALFVLTVRVHRYDVVFILALPGILYMGDCILRSFPVPTVTGRH